MILILTIVLYLLDQFKNYIENVFTNKKVISVMIKAQIKIRFKKIKTNPKKIYEVSLNMKANLNQLISN